MTMSANEKRMMEREALRSVIQQWNANRLDLFELSEPDEVGVSCCALPAVPMERERAHVIGAEDDNFINTAFFFGCVCVQNLQFHGVMRFYFQDHGQKVATKCIRVASDATVQDVIGEF